MCTLHVGFHCVIAMHDMQEGDDGIFDAWGARLAGIDRLVCGQLSAAGHDQ